MLDDLSGPPRTVSIYCDSWGDKVHHIALQVSSEDADRILACVNACKNVSTDTLERMLQGDCPFLDLARKAYWAIYSQQKHLDENDGQLGHSRTALEALRKAFALIGATL